MCNCCLKLYFQTFKQSLSLSYLAVSENFLNQWMTETVVCNNKLKKLMTEGGDRGCCVMIWVIIWVIMLARVWGLMMGYIDGGGAGWSEGGVMLRL